MSRRLGRRRAEDGSSLVEVIVLGVGLLLPLSLSISAMGNAQRAALAVTAATRDAARSASAAGDPSEARAAALRTAAETLAAYGLDPATASVRIEGELRRGGRIGVSVTYPLTIGFGGVFRASTPVRVTSKAQFTVGLHYPMRR